LTTRKLAENQLQEMYRQVERSRNDLRSILNELRIGTVMTDKNGHVIFLNSAARRLFDRPESVFQVRASRAGGDEFDRALQVPGDGHGMLVHRSRRGLGAVRHASVIVSGTGSDGIPSSY